MKTNKITAMIFIAIAPLLFMSCAGKELAKSDLKAPETNMLICLPAFSGAESIALRPEFTISNPNDYMIKASMEYKLSVGAQMVGTSMIPTIYIPPHETIELKDTIVIPFKTWFAGELVSGKSKKETIMAIVPLWKGMEGKRPAALPEGLWKKIPAKKVPMTAKGSLIATYGGEKKIFYFDSKWQD